MKGSGEGGFEDNYYGILQEVIGVEYLGEPLKQCTLFRCNWFDNTPRGTRSPKLYPFIEVNATRRYKKYDPFIFAASAIQVVWYPNGIRDKGNSWVVVPNKSRHKVNNEFTLPVAFQEEQVSHMTPVTDTIPATLLNEEEEIEEINEDVPAKRSEEEQWDDNDDDTEDSK